jgi:pantothenate kinase
MTRFLDDPLDHLLSRLEQMDLPHPRWIIGMSGLPGSGKSTLAAHLAEAVNSRAASNVMMALGMDGFHFTKAQLQQMPHTEELFARRGAPWTFDAAALAQRLASLRDAAGKTTVAWPAFQHEIGDPIEAAYVVAPEIRLVLVEGLYLLHQNDGWQTVSESFDERWYLDTPLEVALQRLTQRHMTAWNLTRAAAEQRIAANDALNAQIVAQTRSRADWFVES